MSCGSEGLGGRVSGGERVDDGLDDLFTTFLGELADEEADGSLVTRTAAVGAVLTKSVEPITEEALPGNVTVQGELGGVDIARDLAGLDVVDGGEDGSEATSVNELLCCRGRGGDLLLLVVVVLVLLEHGCERRLVVVIVLSSNDLGMLSVVLVVIVVVVVGFVVLGSRFAISRHFVRVGIFWIFGDKRREERIERKKRKRLGLFLV